MVIRYNMYFILFIELHFKKSGVYELKEWMKDIIIYELII